MSDEAWAVLAALAVFVWYAFVAPWLGMLIWNWQFGDVYHLTYWQAFWLGWAAHLLLHYHQSEVNGD